MKKFLIFLVSIVVVVCLGLTTFYFMKNDEIITITTKEIYCNAGDSISLESLGIVRKKANRKTTFNYNAGGEEVEAAVKYDEEKGYYVVGGSVAGDVDIVISTSNKKYAEFTIKVHIGNGKQETPYYIFNETDLIKIGSAYGLSDYYQLMNNVTLTSQFQPIGYSEVDSAWKGFSGGFNGNGYTINAMNLTGEYANAGLFSSINSNATVTNLQISNAVINGSYTNAGVLAGVVNGSVDRIAITDATISNVASNSFTGALAGVYNNSTLKMCYAENVTINVGTDSAVVDATVGGLIGKINQATVQATYVNNSQINVFENSTGLFGGFAGEFVIGTETGSIQQSYSNVESENVTMAAFINKISKVSGFAGTKASSIRYLIGNAAVINGATSVVADYDDKIFVAFKDLSNSTYLISDYQTFGDMVADNNNLVFYAIDSQNVVLWDTDYVWQTHNSRLPNLRLGNIEPVSPSGEYFRKDLEEKEVNESRVSFEETFSEDKENEKFKITEDVTLTDWTPVALKNCTIDGGNHTITLALSNAKDGNLGLFSSLDNCSIKNLNIVVLDVTADATNVGALAGTVLSSDEISTSIITNVKVTFEKVGDITATYFGAIVGVAEKTEIKNSIVNSVSVNANIENVGAVVGKIKNSAKVEKVSVTTATLSATANVGGIAGVNDGSILNISTLNVTINQNRSGENANAAGIAGTNSGNINTVNVSVLITINDAKTAAYAGGAVASNSGTIENISLSGVGIEVAEMDTIVYAGGVAAINSGTINFVKNDMVQVGTYNISKNVSAAGVAVVNSGKISKVRVTSSVYGNKVAGVVVEMSTTGSTIDQVYVGNNSIKGDKYVAGVAVVFKAGTITNIQAVSTIVGMANSTRTSLVVLVFPHGAVLKNATISSSISGYGTFYKETWEDFSAYSNKSEFGLTGLGSGDDTFNLYANDTHHGSMQSVVIDSSKTGVSSAKAAMGDAWAWETSYTNSSESSFVKTVSGFTNISQFSGSFEFKCAESSWLGINHYATKTLTFAIGTTWTDNGSGISLVFLLEMV